MGGVVDGQAVDAAITNPAFLEKNADDFTTHKVGLQDTDVVSGPILYNNIQKALNTLDTTTGADESTPGTTYGAPASTINDGDNHETALSELAFKFDPTTGHKHTGSAGDAPPIEGTSLANVPFQGVFEQGVDLTGVTGTTWDVTTELTGKPVSTSPTTQGVVSNPPFNKVILRQASGPDTDDEFADTLGNTIYGRLTWSSPNWTMSFFVELAGVETAYNFLSSVDIRWYYQEVFNPMSPFYPVYSEMGAIPSDNATADVIVATTTLFGKTKLSSSTPPAIAPTGSAGTANGIVANADHTHAQDLFPTTKNGPTTLVDNTSSPTSFFSVSDTGLTGLIVTYAITRNGTSKHGTFILSTDGTNTPGNSSYLDGVFTEFGVTGVVLSADINSSLFRLLYTTTNTGFDATINFEVKEMP